MLLCCLVESIISLTETRLILIECMNSRRVRHTFLLLITNVNDRVTMTLCEQSSAEECKFTVVTLFVHIF